VISPYVDLRASLPLAGRQGRRHSCLAFAASTAHEHARGHGGSLSIEYLYFRAVAHTPGADPNNGAGMEAVALAIAEDGQPAEAIWPYQKIQLYAPHWTPPANLGQLFYANVDVGELDVKEICALLDDRIVVVLGLIVTDGFRTPDELGRVDLVPGDIERGGHAVLAVGYGSGQNGLYVLVRNSWGPKWGIGGYAWVSEAYLEAQLCETATILKGEV
jgi:C1A family cysteine protease